MKRFSTAETEEKQALLVAGLLGANQSSRLGMLILSQASKPYTEEEIDEFVISTDNTDFYRLMKTINQFILKQ